ncbi:MAG: nicotinamide riboside transporter PnuC [Muribaculaceae bacterium]|nr:nicotinamide riboside transporter PnuC [Muribaculaceae bacterium]
MILEITGFTIGLLYLWWEYHADSKVWLASVIMPAISMWIYFSKGLYADFAINIYYLLIAVYGFITWTRGTTKKNKKPLPISHASITVWGGATVSCGLLWYFIWILLSNYTDSTVPVADAFTTSLSIVGLWMMARKYAEQWLIWLIVDIVSSILYFYKGIPFYGILYSIYSVIAVFGYRKWLKIMKMQNKQNL